MRARVRRSKRFSESRPPREAAAAKAPYDILLRRILLGDYPPGAKLVEPDIAEELGISRTPVREALLQFRLEGLVKIIPRGGTFVAEAPVKLIREVTEVRVVLEEYLAHAMVERRSDEWLQEYEQWLRATESVWDRLNPQEWMERDLEFHDRLNVAARNETLSHHLRLLQRQAVLFWTQAPGPRGHLQGIILDFQDTLRAAKERDSRACARVLRRHVLDHVERIRSYMKPDELQYGDIQMWSSREPKGAAGPTG